MENKVPCPNCTGKSVVCRGSWKWALTPSPDLFSLEIRERGCGLTLNDYPSERGQHMREQSCHQYHAQRHESAH